MLNIIILGGVSMSIRPSFNESMSSTTFKAFYWYKEELQQICKRYGLPTYGTKAELSDYIVSFLAGTSIEQINSVRKIRRKTRSSLTADRISLETKLLNSGFSLNKEARIFFADYFGVTKFSFKKSMGIKMREVERNADVGATVADLVEALKIQSIDNDEEKTYQWNSFVKDFRNDPISKEYTAPLKVAAILWKTVRDTDLPKIYDRQLVLKNSELIVKFRK